MKNVFVVLTIFVMLVSCRNSDKTTTNTYSKEQSDKSERQILIEELKKLQQIITSNDREKIGNLFSFPISKSEFCIYIDNDAYNEQLKSNNDRITKEMFLQHYKEIYESIWIEQMNNLFDNINLGSLQSKDTLEYEGYIETEPCFYSYQIEVNGSNVMLRMNMNSNKNYINKNQSEDDISENSSEICEHSLWWNFRFDGKKMYLKEISGAD